MAKSSIDEATQDFILSQSLFFVATAPLGRDGHVNLSPKGMAETFCVLSSDKVCYLDLTGSGAETIAHLRENGRIVLMWCSFGPLAKIVRIWGTGRAHLKGTNAYDELSSKFPRYAGARAVIEIEVSRVASSCGYAVPEMSLIGERPRLLEWAEKKGEDELAEYRGRKNTLSIDGLQGIAP